MKKCESVLQNIHAHHMGNTAKSPETIETLSVFQQHHYQVRRQRPMHAG